MLTAKIISSTSELLDCESAWDNLWQASETHLALMRCQPLALVLERFASDSNVKNPIRVLTCWEGDTLVGALPLVLRKNYGVTIAVLPSDCWNSAGEILLHPDYNPGQTISKLLELLGSVKVNLVQADWIQIDHPNWRLFKDTLERSGQTQFSKHRHDVAMISVPNSVEELEKSWSKNLRKKIRQAKRRLATLGSLELRDYDPNNLESELAKAFEIEDQSWKGANGSSLLANPEMADHFRDLAFRLHKSGNLCLQFLTLDGKPIAFDFGHQGKRIRVSHKVSFLPEYAKMSPGQVMIAMQLEQQAQVRDFDAYDTFGPVSDSVSRWTSDRHSVGRIVFSNKRWSSRVAVQKLGQISSIVSKLRGSVNPTTQ